MSPKRKIVCGKTYFVASRCRDEQEYLKPQKHQDIMDDCIKDVEEAGKCKIHMYEKFPHGFAMSVTTTPGGKNIAEIMQMFKSMVARRINKELGQTGPFWNERYYSIIVEDQENPEAYFLAAMWYFAKAAAKHAKVKSAEESKTSSIKAYLVPGFKSFIKISVHDYFMKLGETWEERVCEFMKYKNRFVSPFSFI